MNSKTLLFLTYLLVQGFSSGSFAQEIQNNTISVLNFGAVADGITDNIDTFRKMISACRV